jgi:hypothetical protein
MMVHYTNDLQNSRPKPEDLMENPMENTHSIIFHPRIIIVSHIFSHMAVCQNLVPLVNIKIAGKWMFIPLKMVLIGIDPYPYISHGDPYPIPPSPSSPRSSAAAPMRPAPTAWPR